ncbi:MAG: phosphatase, partial [Thermoleophilia bacterium]|nr:phosphatase [Thermoleophilia bacterium]
MACDLHMHTNRSDGSHDPAHLVEYAAGRGVDLLAITDHDTMAG